MIWAMVFASRAFGLTAWAQVPGELLLFIFAASPSILYLAFRSRRLVFEAQKRQDTADEFDKLRDEFLTVASHELRTPLSVISGFAEILVRERLGPLNDEQKRRLRKILMQGQRLNRIIDELLDLSRIRSGKITVLADVFDLVPVLKSCLDDQLVLGEQQNLKIIDEIPDVLPDVKGDLERVTQVIVNLLGNAIKYTQSGGTVVLSACFDKKSKQVRVDIRDTGIGIEPLDKAKVFEEFYRSSHKQVRKFPGSGLGLAIVRQLVTAQGGEVGVESEGVGKGSLFYFTLPTGTPKSAPGLGQHPSISSESTPQQVAPLNPGTDIV